MTPEATPQRSKLAGRIGIVAGALLALFFCQQHNAHLSVWSGGYQIKPVGYLLAMIVGAGIGYVVGRWIDRARRPEA